MISKQLFTLVFIILVLVSFVIFDRLLYRDDVLQWIVFVPNNSVLLSSNNQTATTPESTVTVIQTNRPTRLIQKVPLDDPYSSILHADEESEFLDQEVRTFLQKSHKFTFPTKYKKVFVETLDEFDRIWRQELNRTYILYGGTLLGAYRHGETTPWDDDLDILVDLKYNNTLEQDLKGTKFSIKYETPFRKLFFTHNGTTTNKHGHWPFIDLFFFKTKNNGKQMKVLGYDLTYPISFVNPVIRIPHEGRMFLGPRCPKGIIIMTGPLEFKRKCCTHYYNHRLDKGVEKSCISCSKLHGLFRFVTWHRINATHSQQMISEQPEPGEMAALYKKNVTKLKKGPIIFMPNC